MRAGPVMGGEGKMVCRWCAQPHPGRCSQVKALDFDPKTGAVTRVEFITLRDCGVTQNAPPPPPPPPRPLNEQFQVVPFNPNFRNNNNETP
jgi:hypothetical protein